jgi:N-acetyl-anhydromuramyl-L-alanine amidase AmpD
MVPPPQLAPVPAPPTSTPTRLPGKPPTRFTPPPEVNVWKPAVAARDWKYIVLHHTATDSGDVQSIHEAHLKNKDKNGKPWLGIGYHFVIGNGSGMGDGDIEPTFRWHEQMHGAHAGVGEYNQQGIGIVLVGNFDKHPPSTDQVSAVKRLVRVLAREYGVTADRILGHGDVKATECPGEHFPLSEVRGSVALEPSSGLRQAVTPASFRRN